MATPVAETSMVLRARPSRPSQLHLLLRAGLVPVPGSLHSLFVYDLLSSKRVLRKLTGLEMNKLTGSRTSIMRILQFTAEASMAGTGPEAVEDRRRMCIDQETTVVRLLTY